METNLESSDLQFSEQYENLNSNMAPNSQLNSEVLIHSEIRPANSSQQDVDMQSENLM
jgi:hypothetical protein